MGDQPETSQSPFTHFSTQNTSITFSGIIRLYLIYSSVPANREMPLGTAQLPGGVSRPEHIASGMGSVTLAGMRHGDKEMVPGIDSSRQPRATPPFCIPLCSAAQGKRKQFGEMDFESGLFHTHKSPFSSSSMLLGR